jgi:hypothetical protein
LPTSLTSDKFKAAKDIHFDYFSPVISSYTDFSSIRIMYKLYPGLQRKNFYALRFHVHLIIIIAEEDGSHRMIDIIIAYLKISSTKLRNLVELGF